MLSCWHASTSMKWQVMKSKFTIWKQQNNQVKILLIIFKCQVCELCIYILIKRIFWSADRDMSYVFVRLLNSQHICLMYPLSITTVCFSSIFFWTPMRQRNYLNSEKMNVPKQPKEDYIGKTGCMSRIPLFPYFIALWSTPNACFHSAMWKQRAHALLEFNILLYHYWCWPQWDRISFSCVACYWKCRNVKVYTEDQSRVSMEKHPIANEGSESRTAFLIHSLDLFHSFLTHYLK